MNSVTLLGKIGYWVLVVTVLTLPWFFLPITSEFYEFNKNALLLVATIILLLLWSTTNVINRQVRLVRSPLGLPLLLLAAVWLASALLRSPNRVDALLLPGQAGTWLALALFYLTSLSFIRTKDEIDGLVYAWIASMSTVGLVSLLWSSNLIAQLLPSLPAYLNPPLWNPTGSILAASLGLAITLPAVIWLLAKPKNSKWAAALLAFSLLIMVAGLGVNVYRLLNPPSPADKVILLPFSSGWTIALEALKASPFLGTGPATFLADFTRFRPVTSNLTPHWALRFTTSSNWWLQLLTILGGAGLATYLFLVKRCYQLLVKTAHLAKNSAAPRSHHVAMAAALSLLAAFITQLVLPVNFVSIWLVGILIVILVASLRQLGTATVHEANIDIVTAGSNGTSPLLPWTILTLALLLAGVVLYFGGRAYAGEVHYQKALAAAARNDGKTTYDALIAAIGANPYRDVYRLTYSQVNLLLANSIAAKGELSDTDRATITQLVQQAIREAKAAVTLNPTQVINLENLARVYRNLLNFAQGADVWAIAAYQQAIRLDPVNPNLRLDLGGVYYAQKNWDEAVRLFQSAVDLKPDLVNAHYNLAAAYRAKNDLDKAVTVMEMVVSLLNNDTPDYAKASSELAELRQKVGQAAPQPTPAATAASQLSLPEPLPTPAVQPPLKLDQSLSPEAPATPSAQ